MINKSNKKKNKWSLVLSNRGLKQRYEGEKTLYTINNRAGSNGRLLVYDTSAFTRYRFKINCKSVANRRINQGIIKNAFNSHFRYFDCKYLLRKVNAERTRQKRHAQGIFSNFVTISSFVINGRNIRSLTLLKELAQAVSSTQTIFV